MGLWLEVKEKVICLDNECLARAVLEATLEKIAKLNTQTEKWLKNM